MFKKEKIPAVCLCCGKVFILNRSNGYLIGTKDIYDAVFCYDCSKKIIGYFKNKKEESKMDRVIVCCECGRKHTIDMKTGKIIESVKENEFEVGDIVTAGNGNWLPGIVTKVDDDSIYVFFTDGSCSVFSKECCFHKTGLTAKKTLNSLEEVIKDAILP